MNRVKDVGDNVVSVDSDIVKTGPRATIYVDNDADPGWYDAVHVKTIQEGINNASAGDTVFVYNGTYYENVIIDKSINLEGEERNTTVIDGNNFGDVVYVSADWVNISGFTSKNGWAGIDLHASNNNIFGNNILNNGYGMEVHSSSNNAVLGNIISSNNYDGFRLSLHNITPCMVILKGTVKIED